MRSDLTELVFILDCSGSMFGMVSDTIGGFNRVLAENRAMPGGCTVTTVLFNDKTSVLHDHLPIAGVKELTEKEYCPGGMTALLDAVGMAIAKIDGIQAHTAESERAEKVQFVIITDGLENSSREYSLEQIRSLISARKEKGWDFLFLGANIDAVKVAGGLGIAPDRSVEMLQDKQGYAMAYASIGRANRAYRMQECAEPADAWKAEVEADTRARKRR